MPSNVTVAIKDAESKFNVARLNAKYLLIQKSGPKCVQPGDTHKAKRSFRALCGWSFRSTLFAKSEGVCRNLS